MNGGGVAIPQIGTQAVPWTALPTVVIQRPNDATAYAFGDVFGDAADARITIGGMTPGRRVSSIRFAGVHNRSATEATLSLSVWPFLSQPATVLGDNVPLVLSDPDCVLAAVASGGNTNSTLFNFSANSATWLSNTAGVNGRRLATAALMSLGFVAPANGNMYLYPFVTAAYACIANELVTLYPFVQYVV